MPRHHHVMTAPTIQPLVHTRLNELAKRDVLLVKSAALSVPAARNSLADAETAPLARDLQRGDPALAEVPLRALLNHVLRWQKERSL